MLKKVILVSCCAMLYYNVSAIDAEKNIVAQKKSSLNIKAAHERGDNLYPFGKNNTSAFALNPQFVLNENCVIEGDFYYGRQYTYVGATTSPSSYSQMTSYENRADFYDTFSVLNPSSGSAAMQKPHFYRNFARMIYTNREHDYRVIIGDTASKNTIGFQNVISGGGVSVFRQGGNGEEVNAGLPIVITRVSKLEVKRGSTILIVHILKPGVYTINDFPEEAKLPDVSLKITDQLGRSEKIKIRYFSGYDTPETGKDDFDFTVVCSHKWNLEDMHRMRYCKKPILTSNYRYALSDTFMIGVGAQGSENKCILDSVAIFTSEIGKFAPNVAFSNAYFGRKSKRAAGVGFYYALPQNSYGIGLETFFAAKGLGFGNIQETENREDEYNQFMDKYFSPVNAIRFRNNPSTSSSSRQITARLFSEPINNISPSFVFNGEWSASNRWRDYTLCLSTKLFDICSVTIAGGLTYDDPYKGKNRKAPDRRLLLSCTINLNTEISIDSSFYNSEEDSRKLYTAITYTPKVVKGLSMCAERFSAPGRSMPQFNVKYDGEFFNLKAEENITNTYEDRGTGAKTKHDNRQRYFFGTNVSMDGFKAHQDRCFNVLK